MDKLLPILADAYGWVTRASLYAIVAIIIISFVQMLGRRWLPAKWSYALWLVLLVRMALPVGPESSLSLWNLVPQRIHWASPATSVQLTGPPDHVKPDSISSAVSSGVLIPKGIDADARQRIRSDSKPASVLQTTWPLAPVVWLVGALSLIIGIAVSNLRLWQSVRKLRLVTEQSLLELFEDCKQQMQVRTVVGLVSTDRVKSPSLFGFIRPRILLPTGLFGTIRPEELRDIFLHELAHLKRGDIWIGWLVALLQSLHWFNPLVWWAFVRMRADRELACDALALSYMQGEDSSHYGGALINLLERFSHTQHLPAVAGILENKAQLKRRLTMIAKFKRPTLFSNVLAIALLVLLSGCLLTDSKGNHISQTPPGQVTSSNPKVQDILVKGVQAFTENKYDAAIQFFEKAIQLDPGFEAARLYLATTYSAKYAIGEKPYYDQMAQKAIEIFKEIVAKAKDPAKPNRDAMLCIAGLYHQLDNFDESREWSNRILEVYPQTAEAYCRIAAVIYDNAIGRTGFQGENMILLSSEEKSKTQTDIEEGLTYLNKALEIRPDFLTAMEYQNLLLREKSMLEKDEKVKADLKRQAVLLAQKAMTLRLNAGEEVQEPTRPDTFLQVLAAVPLPPPPIPPPPPLPLIKVNIRNLGAAFNMDHLAGSMMALENQNGGHWSTPVLIEDNHGICTFLKPISPGAYKLRMDPLGINANIRIPPSQGTPITLNMDISPSGISITVAK